MPHAATCLWFAPDVAPRAVELYTTLIPGSRVIHELRLDNGEAAKDCPRLWTLEIAGREVRVMGALHGEAFTTAHSMWLVLDDQAQLDHVWDGFLAAGGEEVQCGWITDPFGVRWQVLPQAWEDLTRGGGDQAQRVAEALWQMVKVDVAGLEAAARDTDA